MWSNRSLVAHKRMYFLRGWLNENIAEEVIDEKRDGDVQRSGKPTDSEGMRMVERSGNYKVGVGQLKKNSKASWK